MRDPSHRQAIPAYESLSLSKILGRTKVHFPRRVFMDIEIGVVVKVLDLVGPWFQFSVLEDGWRHGQSRYDGVAPCTRHTLIFPGKE